MHVQSERISPRVRLSRINFFKVESLSPDSSVEYLHSFLLGSTIDIATGIAATISRSDFNDYRHGG